MDVGQPVFRSEYCRNSRAPWCGRWLCRSDASGVELYDGYCPNCCPKCREIGNRLMHIVIEKERDYRQQLQHAHERLDAHLQSCHGKTSPNSHDGNGRHCGAFAFTLTASPDDGKTEADMVAAVRKVMNQRSCPVKRYAWYLEYGNEQQKTHPHIHGLYETEKGGVIEKKHWQRAWNIWDPAVRLGAGFRGGYHRPVRDDESYSMYIRKQKFLGESIGCHDSPAASPAAPPASPVDMDASA